uniref:Uncharacterized protein n=1 Tax=Gossypium raimondii TaxID=29730 RepID=A0A0D2PYI0_GOSRA|nr:hypothetical protein B456_008G203700 [Gossypium raimondii]
MVEVCGKLKACREKFHLPGKYHRIRFSWKSNSSNNSLFFSISPSLQSLAKAVPIYESIHPPYKLSYLPMSQEELAKQAIKHALKALKKRHLVEEGAHAPAYIALSRPIISQDRDEYSQLKTDFEEKLRALELVLSECKELKAQLEQLTIRATNAEAENKRLVDLWMLQKMQDAERLNEANALYEDMTERLKASGLEKLAREQVDGIVRRSEEGAEFFVESTVPSVCKDRINAHDGGCASIMFEYNSQLQRALLQRDGLTICSGHVDRNLRLWDIQTVKLLSEVSAHSLAITSLSLGRDNSHNLFDIRSLEVFGTFRATGNKVASNWSRSCISLDDNNIAAGSADGSIYIWSISKADIVSTLKEHTAPILCCTWSAIGKPLASADKNGVVCTWT